MARSGRRRNPPRPTAAIKATIAHVGKTGATGLGVGRPIGVIAGPSVVPPERREVMHQAEQACQPRRVVEAAESDGNIPVIVVRGRVAAVTIAAGHGVKVAMAAIAVRASSTEARVVMVVRAVTADEVDRIVVRTTAPTTR